MSFVFRRASWDDVLLSQGRIIHLMSKAGTHSAFACLPFLSIHLGGSMYQ